ncbi:NAD-P-binding protein [Pilatotrama ljubarskyi]|nr:NAD-P-binding protein [Pilatotrama ljubarskyi]
MLRVALFPSKPKWNPDHLPDLSSKVFLVTGGNTGIGRETVKRLLMKNAKVYLAARSKDKATRTIEELREETGKEALFLQLDLGDLNAVKKAAEEYKQRESQLDVLYLNAGMMYPPPANQITPQGYEATFATNVIGHFLLVRLLYPLLAASGREGDPSRIVWLSSMSSFRPSRLTYEAYREGPAQKKADPFDLYSESKLAAAMLSNHLAKTCIKDNIVSVAVDPGNIKTEIYREESHWTLKVWDRIMSYPLPYGALSSLWAGGSPEGAKLNGKYIEPWCRVHDPAALALNVQEQEKLWTWVEEQAKPYL